MDTRNTQVTGVLGEVPEHTAGAGRAGDAGRCGRRRPGESAEAAWEAQCTQTLHGRTATLSPGSHVRGPEVMRGGSGLRGAPGRQVTCGLPARGEGPSRARVLSRCRQPPAPARPFVAVTH